MDVSVQLKRSLIHLEPLCRPVVDAVAKFPLAVQEKWGKFTIPADPVIWEAFKSFLEPTGIKIQGTVAWPDKGLVDDPIKWDNTLYDYQVVGANHLRRHRRCILADEMGLGKEQPVDAKILTPVGWSTMGEMRPGCFVIGRDGKPVKVFKIYPQGVKPVYKVTFSDHSSTECGLDHLWAVTTSNRRFRGSSYLVLSLQELLSRGIKKSDGCRKWFIPMADSVEFYGKSLPVDPYLLGALLGNGGLSRHSIVFSTGNEDLRKEIENILHRDFPGLSLRYNGGVDYSISSGAYGGSSNFLLTRLQEMGLMGKRSASKFVPNDYLYRSTGAERLALLQGLMDCDCYVMPGTCTIEWSTASKQMMSDITFLVQSLGGTLRLGKIKVVNGKEYYRASISLPTSMLPVTTPCKLNNFKPREKYAPYRAIESVEYVGEKECQCIEVDGDHLYLTDDCIVTHNTKTIVDAVADLHTLIIAPLYKCEDWVKALEERFPSSMITKAFGKHKEYKKVKVKEAINYWGSQIVVTNYEKINPKFKELYSTFWDTIVLEEAHFLQNRSSARTKAIAQLCNNSAFHVRNVWMLTGTPVWSEPNTVWSLLNILDPSRFSSYWRFIESFCTMRDTKFAREITGVRQDTLPIFREILGDFMIRRTKKDVLNLPSRIEHEVLINSDKSLLKELRLFKRAMKDDEGYVNLCLLRGKVLELGGKKEELARILELEKGRKILIFVKYRASASLVLGWLKDDKRFSGLLDYINDVPITGDITVADREVIIKQFQETPGGGALLGTAKCMGTGIDLQAASVVVFIEHPFLYSELEQCCGRIERIGTTEVPTYYHVVQKGTVDEKIWRTCIARSSTAEGIIS